MKRKCMNGEYVNREYVKRELMKTQNLDFSCRPLL